MRFAKFSRELTKAAKFKDRRSKIGIRADGSLRYDLAGLDKGDLREKVFTRDEFGCVDARTIVDLLCGPVEISKLCVGPLEMSHWPPMSKSGGSDEMATCFCRCRKHHRLLDGNQVQLRKVS